jgi:hypothetical protein
VVRLPESERAIAEDDPAILMVSRWSADLTPEGDTDVGQVSDSRELAKRVEEGTVRGR